MYLHRVDLYLSKKPQPLALFKHIAVAVIAHVVSCLKLYASVTLAADSITTVYNL